MSMTSEAKRRLLPRIADRLRHLLLDIVDAVAGTGSSLDARARPSRRIGVGIVGCGFVADFYSRTIPHHPGLLLVGAFDQDINRTVRFADRNGCGAFNSLEEMLADERIEIVINLTNPSSHSLVSRKILDAGRHLYSEKPLAMVQSEAQELVALASQRGLLLSGAPCTLLGDTAELLKQILARGEIGKVRTIYAELDDGPIHQMHPEDWVSPDGTPWPWRDEFQVGCTLEHAGYHLSWLIDLFGPVRHVTAFSALIWPDKNDALDPTTVAPDFSVACLVFGSGVVARLTCSVVSPHNHSILFVGDQGTIEVDECWHGGAPVIVRPSTSLSLRARTYAWVGRIGWAKTLFGLDGRKIWPRQNDWRRNLRRHEIDYAQGVAALAHSIVTGAPLRMSASRLLHLNEVVLAIHKASSDGLSSEISSTFEYIEPAK